MPTLTAKNTESPKSKAPEGFKQKTEKKEFPPIPTGTYDVEVVRMEYRTKEEALANGKFWGDWKDYDAEVNIGFRVSNGEYQNRWFFGDTQADLSHGSKLRIWIQEITGFNPLPDDFEFDTDELDDYIGLDCRLKIVRKPNKKGEERNYIQEVLRADNSTYEDVEDYF